MPVRVVDLDDGRGNLIEYSGVFTRDEMISAVRDHLKQDSEKFARYLYSLIDLTGVTDFQGDSEAVRQLARGSQEAAATSPDAIVAVVVGGDELFGLARMWELHMGDLTWEVKILRSRHEAEEWIRARVQDRFGASDLRLA